MKKHADLELMRSFIDLAMQSDRRTVMAAVTWMLNRARDKSTVFGRRDPELVAAMHRYDVVAKERRAIDAQLSRLISTRKVLREIYAAYGPGGDGTLDKYPAVKYAELSTAEIDAKWDFSDRHLMHRVAKALVRIAGDAADGGKIGDR